MGRDKALEEIGGETLIQRVIHRLSSLGTDIIVAASRDLPLPPGVKRVADIYPGKGALGGIYSGLRASPSPRSLVVACDMPFLNLALLRHLMELAPSFDVVIPRVNGQLQPLHAVYSQNCLGPIEAMLHEDRLKIAGLFPAVRVRYVEDAEVERFDPQKISFFNINSQADLMRAREMVERNLLEHVGG